MDLESSRFLEPTQSMRIPWVGLLEIRVLRWTSLKNCYDGALAAVEKRQQRALLQTAQTRAITLVISETIPPLPAKSRHFAQQCPAVGHVADYLSSFGKGVDKSCTCDTVERGPGLAPYVLLSLCQAIASRVLNCAPEN